MLVPACFHWYVHCILLLIGRWINGHRVQVEMSTGRSRWTERGPPGIFFDHKQATGGDRPWLPLSAVKSYFRMHEHSTASTSRSYSKSRSRSRSPSRPSRFRRGRRSWSRSRTSSSSSSSLISSDEGSRFGSRSGSRLRSRSRIRKASRDSNRTQSRSRQWYVCFLYFHICNNDFLKHRISSNSYTIKFHLITLSLELHRRLISLSLLR